MATDKVAQSSDQQEESWIAQIWKRIAADEALHGGRSTSKFPEGAREAAPQMLAMESRGDLPTFRTSC
jgi:hypothetical protein